MQKYILKSEKVIELNIAPIDTALELYIAVVNACKGAGLDITIAEETTIADLFNKNIDALLNVISSKEVIEAIKECAIHCLYNKQKFSMALFEDKSTRTDFIPFMTLVCVENLRYFFGEAHIIFDVVLSNIVK